MEPTPKPKRKRASPRDAHSWKASFLAGLRNSGNVRAATNAAAVSRAMVYKLRDADPAFAAEWDEAVTEAVELLEAACRQRALKGSDLLMMFLLKAARPDKYRDRYDVRVGKETNQEIVVDLHRRQEDND